MSELDDLADFASTLTEAPLGEPGRSARRMRNGRKQLRLHNLDRPRIRTWGASAAASTTRRHPPITLAKVNLPE